MTKILWIGKNYGEVHPPMESWGCKLSDNASITPKNEWTALYFFLFFGERTSFWPSTRPYEWPRHRDWPSVRDNWVRVWGRLVLGRSRLCTAKEGGVCRNTGLGWASTFGLVSVGNGSGGGGGRHQWRHRFWQICHCGGEETYDEGNVGTQTIGTEEVTRVGGVIEVAGV